jgi:biotin carboxyl carrier protein
MSSAIGAKINGTTAPRKTFLAIVASALAIGSLASPAIADQYIYWGGGDVGLPGSIQRASINGTGANPNFMTGLAGGRPVGFALNGTKIFWAGTPDAPGSPFVASANLGGTNQVNPLISVSGPSEITPFLAADSGHVYYGISLSGFGGPPTQLKRADPDGSNPTNLGSLVSGGLSGLAVDSNYLYFIVDGAKISRVGLDGSNPTDLVTGLTNALSVTVNSSYIYWGNSTGSAIGRANLDGTSPNTSFISGLSKPAGVSIDSSHIFWTNASTGSIGRADIGGGNANTSFVTGAFTTGSVPVTGLAVTSGGGGAATAPAAPTALVATSGNGSASIAFTAGADNGSAITNYEYSTNNGSTWTTRSPAATTSPISISGLTNGTAYNVKLRAVNNVGAGAESSAVSVTPVDPTPPPTPTPTPKPAKPSAKWSSSAKKKTVTAVITPVAGVTYTLTAKSGRKTKKGSCKNVTIKQGKKKLARRSCKIKLAKGKWLASVTPKKGSVSGTVNSKRYTFK